MVKKQLKDAGPVSHLTRFGKARRPSINAGRPLCDSSFTVLPQA
jgi:hypothetical protein